MFWTVHVSIIRSLYTVHSAMVYVIQVCRQLLSRTILVLLESWFCYGFIIKKFVTMHGHERKVMALGLACNAESCGCIGCLSLHP